MTKLGARLSAVLAGILFGPMIAVAADPLSLDIPSTGTLMEAAPPTRSFPAGFIRPATPYDALVSQITGDNQITGNRRLLGSGDQIYLELSKPQEVAPGDKFTIYRRLKRVFHPTRGRYLGDLTAVLGVVKVVRVTDGKATVKIINSYDAIYPGDGAMRQPASPQPEPASSGQSLPEGTGLIIEIPPGQNLIAQGNVVYIDWGRNEGVKLGDRLEVLREKANIPLQVIGELEVIAVEDLTSTARISRSLAPIQRGDLFASKSTQQTQLGLDVPPSPQARKDTLFQEMTKPAPAAEAVQEAHAAPQSRDIERELAQLARQLEFEPGSAPATAAGLPILNRMKALLKEVPDRRVVVKGYTDNQKVGPSLKELYNSNQELSRARAAAVADSLAGEGGANPQNISVVGYADAKPVASNSTETGRKKNRRIEIQLLPAELPSAPAPADVMTEPAPGIAAPPAP